MQRHTRAESERRAPDSPAAARRRTGQAYWASEEKLAPVLLRLFDK